VPPFGIVEGVERIAAHTVSAPPVAYCWICTIGPIWDGVPRATTR